MAMKLTAEQQALRSTLMLALGFFESSAEENKADYSCTLIGLDTVEIKFETGYSVFMKAEKTL